MNLNRLLFHVNANAILLFQCRWLCMAATEHRNIHGIRIDLRLWHKSNGASTWHDYHLITTTYMTCCARVICTIRTECTTWFESLSFSEGQFLLYLLDAVVRPCILDRKRCDDSGLATSVYMSCIWFAQVASLTVCIAVMAWPLCMCAWSLK